MSVPGGSGGGGVTVEGGTGGVFDERAAFMASLSYAMCFGMRMGVNVGMRAVVLDPDECATDAAAATSVQASDGTTVVVKVTAADVSTLLAEGSGITRQPPGPEVLLTKDFIVYTSPDTQVLTTTVAGTEVTIHATPTSYTWNWGDGTTTTTTDPGAPWPNQTLTHRYTRTATDVTTTLTTTWKATYTPNGGTTTPVVGTITTTNTTTPYNIVRTITYLTDQAETQQGH
ncbi:zinc transporter [Actinomyces qiguomingii]|uniref:zinc transporter n=1 Tax=Actinomyces qiguomingii TaxID=2057800 RepID=UPI001FD5B3CD|nr:zinc transporter [Actinomyces qiguomingii]